MNTNIFGASRRPKLTLDFSRPGDRRTAQRKSAEGSLSGHELRRLVAAMID